MLAHAARDDKCLEEASARLELFLSFFCIFFFLKNLQDERRQPAPGDPAAGEHVSDLCAAELQGKIQHCEAANKVFLQEQQIRWLVSLTSFVLEGGS